MRKQKSKATTLGPDLNGLDKDQRVVAWQYYRWLESIKGFLTAAAAVVLIWLIVEIFFPPAPPSPEAPWHPDAHTQKTHVVRTP